VDARVELGGGEADGFIGDGGQKCGLQMV
jgi:hypothetical protein